LTWGWRDRLPALYQLDDLVGFPGEVTVRPERIVPTAIRAEIKDMKVRKIGIFLHRAFLSQE